MSYSDINLLPAAQWHHSWLAYFFRWIISYGRYVLIFTELIVILAFLSRFKLDQDLADLNDKIKTDKIILQSSVGFEKQVRQTVQNQVLTAREWENQLRWSYYLQAISQVLPSTVVIKKMDAATDHLTLVGSSSSLKQLNSFLNNLKASPAFQNVNLEKINTSLTPSQQNLITFSISLTPTKAYVKY